MRRFLSLVVVVLACTFAVVPAASTSTPARPNIVFVLTDDLAMNLVTPELTPNLWSLMQSGAHFSNYFVADSLCCPSRASIFTGRLPHDTGVLSNVGPHGGYMAFMSHHDNRSTLATDLHHVGYRTAMMGKYLNRYQTRDPVARGWTTWDVANWGYPEFHYSLNENGHIVHYGGHHGRRDNYLTDVISRLGRSFIHRTLHARRPHPFFLELATFTPHSPYTPAPRDSHLYPNIKYPATPAFDANMTNPPRWLGHRAPMPAHAIASMRNSFRRRAQDMASVDRMIGDVMATVRANGAANDTYFVFSSDNGLHMGEYGLAPGKLTAFDTDIHVPLIVAGPGITPDSTVTQFAENIDLRSTFDSLAGTRPSERVDGRSLAPLLLDRTHSAPSWRQGIVVEHRGPARSRFDPDRQRPRSGNPPSYVAIRTADWLFVKYADGEREFHNLRSDPYELHNTYASLSRHDRRMLLREVQKLHHCRDHSACSAITNPLPSL